MIDDLGVCKGSGTVLGEFKAGSVSIQLSKIGKSFYFLVDGRAVLSARSEKDLVANAIPVVAQAVKSLMKSAQEDDLRWKPIDKNYSRLMDQTLKAISENMKPAEMFVLELKPDEIKDNSTVDASEKPSIVDSLDDYRVSLKKFAQTIEAVNHGSSILLRTELDKGMWGSRDVMAILGEIKSEMAGLSEASESLDACFEQSDRQARFVQAAIGRRIAADHMKTVVGGAIENFSKLKSYMSCLAQASQKLYVIDNVFKSRVGYPATWFFNGSIYMDYLFDHENLVDHLIKMASLESCVIEPLLVWKIKMAGE